MNVDIRIDELVLRGFPAITRHRIADALQAEMARLFAASPNAIEHIRGVGTVDSISAHLRVPAGASPERIGRGLARSLHDTIAPAPTRPLRQGIARNDSRAVHAPAPPAPAAPTPPATPAVKAHQHAGNVRQRGS
jgi:hypothetical protein